MSKHGIDFYEKSTALFDKRAIIFDVPEYFEDEEHIMKLFIISKRYYKAREIAERMIKKESCHWMR